MGDVREIKLTEVNQMYDLAVYAFNAERSVERRKRFDWIVSHSDRYGFFVEDRLQSQLISTPFKVNFHGADYDMAGIGCVSSYPESRGQGGVTKLMTTLLKELAEKKVALSYLAPFSYPFYRKYGYEQLFEQISYTVPPNLWLNRTVYSGKVSRVDWLSYKDAGNRLYNESGENQRGAVIREDWWLDYKYGMSEEYQFALFQDEQGKVEGGLVYHSAAERFTIYEWFYKTLDAFSGLSSFIGSHGSSSKEFYYKTSFSGNTMNKQFAVPTISTIITPYMMGRIVDFQTFLTDYPFKYEEKHEAFTLEIQDPYGSWNDGVWEFSVEKGKVNQLEKVEKLAEDTIIRGDIQTWTQVFMGARDGKELDFFGELTGDENQLFRLVKLLPEGKPVLNDYF